MNKPITVNEIALEIQNKLGDDFKIYVDNNTGVYHDVELNATVDDQLYADDGRVIGILSTDVGEIVALPDLFSTSFGFVISFDTPTSNKTAESDLYALVDTLNGSLHVGDGSKWLMTLATPSAVGAPRMFNGEYYQTIMLSGSVAITNYSMFGNELNVSWDGVDLKKMLITATPSLQFDTTDADTEGDDLIPKMGYVSAHNTLDLTLHLRNDEPLATTLLGYVINPMNLANKTIDISLSGIGVSNDWECLVLSIAPTFSIGGYVIMDVALQRVKVIE